MEKATHTKDAQTEKNGNQSMLTVKDHMLPTVKGVQLIKTGVLPTCDGQPKNLCLHSEAKCGPPPQPKGDTFTFSADRLIKFVVTVAIQIAQPQVCCSNAPKDAVDKTSSLCGRVSKAAKNQLRVSIGGSTLFDAIGSVHAPMLPTSKIPVVIPEPFRFSTSTNHQPSLAPQPPTFTDKTVPKQSSSSN